MDAAIPPAPRSFRPFVLRGALCAGSLINPDLTLGSFKFEERPGTRRTAPLVARFCLFLFRPLCPRSSAAPSFFVCTRKDTKEGWFTWTAGKKTSRHTRMSTINLHATRTQTRQPREIYGAADGGCKVNRIPVCTGWFWETSCVVSFAFWFSEFSDYLELVLRARSSGFHVFSWVIGFRKVLFYFHWYFYFRCSSRRFVCTFYRFSYFRWSNTYFIIAAVELSNGTV